MREAEQDLLARILASKPFANASSLKRVLKYLCDQTHNPESSPLQEYSIALDALGRPPDFDPKLDPIVRVDVAQIRRRLQTYFDTEGRHERLRLAIPKGQYRVAFTERDAAEAERPGEAPDATALERFWRPYLDRCQDNVLMITELLFFRDSKGNFVRNIYVNDLSSARTALAAKVPDLILEGFQPSYHFVSAGEVHCMLALVNAFSSMGVPLDCRNSRFSSWNTLRDTNVIVLGSSRTNSFLDSLQGGEDFVITAERIENRAPQAGEREFYCGTRFLDGNLETVTEYAVVTRRRGLVPSGAITTIAGNHGRAIEGAGMFLTDETQLQELLASRDIVAGERLPDHFQLLLAIDLVDYDEEVVRVSTVADRGLRRSAPRVEPKKRRDADVGLRTG